MAKSLTAKGNGWSLTINKNLIKLIGLDPENSELQFKIKDKVLYIRGIEPDDTEYSKSLIKKFGKKNTSYYIYFPEAILEVLDINAETDKVKIEIEDNIMIIRKEN